MIHSEQSLIKNTANVKSNEFKKLVKRAYKNKFGMTMKAAGLDGENRLKIYQAVKKGQFFTKEELSVAT